MSDVSEWLVVILLGWNPLHLHKTGKLAVRLQKLQGREEGEQGVEIHTHKCGPAGEHPSAHHFGLLQQLHVYCIQAWRAVRCAQSWITAPLNLWNGSFLVTANVGDITVVCYDAYESVPFVPLCLHSAPGWVLQYVGLLLSSCTGIFQMW